jgi:hypothetical protein
MGGEVTMLPVIIMWLVLSPFAVYHAPEFVAGHEANKKIKSAMRYHGTLDAYEVSPNIWKFQRQGRECTLFTEAFEEKWRES